MRTRSRVIVDKVGAVAAGTHIAGFYEWSASSNQTYNAVLPAYGWTLEEIQESMTDSLGRKQPHSVIHRRKKIQIIGSDAIFKSAGTFAAPLSGPCVVENRAFGYANYSNDINTRFVVDHTGVWNVGNTDFPSSWQLGTANFNEDVLKNDVIEKAHQLKADALLNAVEAHQIVPSVRSLTGSLPSMARNWKSIRKHVKTASGSYLAWKFGISPILSDIMATHRYLKNVKKSFQRHVEQEPIRAVAYAMRSAEFSGYVPGPTVQNSVTTWEWTHTGKVHIAPTIRYVLVVKPEVPLKTKLFQALDLALSRFATSPADLAWELVPFSFVLDWFVDVRGALRLVDQALGVTPFSVISFTRSFNYHMSNEVSVTRKAPFPSNPIVLRSGPIGSIEFKHYERSVVSMRPSWPQWKPRFGKNQAAISAALIAQALTKTSRFSSKLGRIAKVINGQLDDAIMRR